MKTEKGKHPELSGCVIWAKYQSGVYKATAIGLAITATSTSSALFAAYACADKVLGIDQYTVDDTPNADVFVIRRKAAKS